MATWVAYLVAAITWVVWMVGYAILDYTLGDYILPLAEELGGDFVAQPVSWMNTVLANWAIVGGIGILIALIAAAVATPSKGGVV